ncbi:MAG: rhodanese-like domain-containing protein [Gammaproteobacteria bacterium]|jgi:rhodanese-related sulfurtransferase|nr:rhodanese-like domain-containing protein [Gammaproteobacteria bacterium]
MQEISAKEAAELLSRNPESTLLLDVREPAELAAAAVADALHIPMGEIPARLHELNRDKTIVCMCHLGGRSAQVAAFLASQGFADVINLAGGIEAWADDVDPGVRR